jgi:methylmalonyl-CoA mutase
MSDLFGFEPATREDWLKRVAAVLRGVDFEDRLVSKTADGIRIEPLYGQTHGPRAARAEYAPWTVFQRADHPDAAKANTQAIDDLNHGTTGLTLVFKDHPAARGFGIAIHDLRRVLDGIALHAIALRIEGSTDAAQALARLIAAQPLNPEKLDISFGLSEPAAAKPLIAQGFRGPLMEADGRQMHEQGGTEAQELGVVLAHAVSHLRALERPLVGVTLAADQDTFLTLSKFRAMRLLWARVLEVSGIPQSPLRIHGETSWRMLATRDPHTNILRACAAVFGAGLGGADSISVLPFSIAQGLPNAFARRVARNVQNILVEESNLWRVADPASGSGYVEHLTHQLCDKAWDVFRKTERGERPTPDASNARTLPIIGTSVHPLPEEYSAETEAVA